MLSNAARLDISTRDTWRERSHSCLIANTTPSSSILTFTSSLNATLYQRRTGAKQKKGERFTSKTWGRRQSHRLGIVTRSQYRRKLQTPIPGQLDKAKQWDCYSYPSHSVEHWEEFPFVECLMDVIMFIIENHLRVWQYIYRTLVNSWKTFIHLGNKLYSSCRSSTHVVRAGGWLALRGLEMARSILKHQLKPFSTSLEPHLSNQSWNSLIQLVTKVLLTSFCCTVLVFHARSFWYPW